MTATAHSLGAVLCRPLLTALLLAFSCAAPQRAQAEPSEQQVKAALIFNVTRFVEWPESTFGSATSPLTVAIIGQDGVSDALESILRKKFVNGHPVLVRHVNSPDAARKCHVLYVASSEQRNSEAIVSVLRGSPTLTVAESNQFAERGGHIHLLLQDRRIQLVVNPTRAAEAQLKISARLLSLARIVEAP